MNVVLITACHRPEFLWLCLEHIVNSNNYNENHFIINLDKGFRRSNLDVIRQFSPRFNSLEINYTPIADIPASTKQSYAVLEGYRKAQQKTQYLVYMIEEDVMISNEFFNWHKAIHAVESDIYCSIATRNNNTRRNPIGDYSAYYLQTGDYQSLGVCFKKHMLNIILEHANYNYYNDPWRYCATKWPDSPVGKSFVEQDGLHRRAMGDLPVAFSYDGYAHHAGFYGYNRRGSMRLTGSLDQKVQQIRDIAFNATRLKTLIQANGLDMAYYYDSEPISLKINWNGNLNKI